MAILPDPSRANVWAKFMRTQSAKHALLSGAAGSKRQLRLAVDAADDRFEFFVNGLTVPPVAALSDLSITQRLELIRELITERLGE